jgi:hypothetical protein
VYDIESDDCEDEKDGYDAYGEEEVVVPVIDIVSLDNAVQRLLRKR